MEKPAATRSACTEKIEGGRETGKHKMSESSLCNGLSISLKTKKNHF